MHACNHLSALQCSTFNNAVGSYMYVYSYILLEIVTIWGNKSADITSTTVGSVVYIACQTLTIRAFIIVAYVYVLLP